MNALLLALAIFSGAFSALSSAQLTYDSPAIGSVAAPVAADQPETPAPAPAKIALPACDEEDDTVTSSGKQVAACYWDAKLRNSTGASFTKYAGTETVLVYDK